MKKGGRPKAPFLKNVAEFAKTSAYKCGCHGWSTIPRDFIQRHTNLNYETDSKTTFSPILLC